MKKWSRAARLPVVFGVLLSLSLGLNAVQSARMSRLEMRLAMERQREMADVVRAMADIEINLQKLLIASGASQSAELLGETALLAQHVESGLSRLPLGMQTAADAMKFAGQMGDYTMTLAAQVSGGSTLTTTDEAQIEDLLAACQGLNAHLNDMHGKLYDGLPSDRVVDTPAVWPEDKGDNPVEYPSLIYDGPFSDGKKDVPPKGLTGDRITREQARQAAARFAGTTVDRVSDAADSGGRFEAFGFAAQTDSGRLSVQVTGQGGHLLWMMPEDAEYAPEISREDCLRAADAYLAKLGFDEMQRCFVQEYDGMVVANYVSVQDGVLLYPDQVKLQISRETGTVVGAECSQYLAHHEKRQDLEPELSIEQAQLTISDRLNVADARLCVIPEDRSERLCWEFRGAFSGAVYYVYVDAKTGEAAEILRIAKTQDGETAI